MRVTTGGSPHHHRYRLFRRVWNRTAKDLLVFRRFLYRPDRPRSRTHLKVWNDRQLVAGEQTCRRFHPWPGNRSGEPLRRLPDLEPREYRQACQSCRGFGYNNSGAGDLYCRKYAGSEFLWFWSLEKKMLPSVARNALMSREVLLRQWRRKLSRKRSAVLWFRAPDSSAEQRPRFFWVAAASWWPQSMTARVTTAAHRQVSILLELLRARMADSKLNKRARRR